MKAATQPVADQPEVLARAVYAAADYLGLTRVEAARVIGRNRSSIDRNGIDPESKPGELALMLVRVYRSLYALMGGDQPLMQHFMQTANHGTGGVPRQQVQQVQGLVTVCEYLDAVRGKG